MHMAPRVPLTFGTMTFGRDGCSGVRTSNLKDCQKILDTFLAENYTEIDTARKYGDGTSEEHLSKLSLGDAVVDTGVHSFKPGDHSPVNFRRIFEGSLTMLKRQRVRTLYLHAPQSDRTVSFEETLSIIDKMHKEGRFERFGLSNYAAWEVAEIVGICRRENYVIPSVYQAMYNPITRAIEAELVPCLRKFGLRLVIYNPLAGGLLAGNITSKEQTIERGSRFDPNTKQGRTYRARYLKDKQLEALETIKEAADKAGLRMTEVALRWLQHHSILNPEDGVIIGASSVEQMEQNCEDSVKGPLPQEVVDALEAANDIVGNRCPRYWT